MYSIIFSIIVIYFLVSQSNRIKRIEQRLESGSSPVKPNVVSSTPITNTTNQTQTPVPPPPPVHKNEDVSTEEASGRILGRLGISAVIIGVAFFLKYAFDNNWVNPVGRVMIGILAGLIAMGIAQYLRKKYLQYSDLLMGGGLVILYLSVFAAQSIYNLIDPMLTFLGMIIVTLIGVTISIRNSTKTLSMISFIGAFLTPSLVGVGNLGEFIIFTYVTILNLGILGILLYKKWMNLVLAGLIGTWYVFGGWMISSYDRSLLTPTLLFMLVQFLIFNTASVFRIIVEKVMAEGLDYLVLLVTAWSFSLTAYGLVLPGNTHYISLGCVLIAGFYIVIALMSYKANPSDRTLNIFLPGLAVAFLTVAVPMEFSGYWVAAWWFIEALVLYILASTSSSRGFQVAGVIVYILGLTNLLNYLAFYNRSEGYIVFFNGPFIMILMAVVIAYIIAYIYYRYGSITPEIQKRGMSAFVIIANILTLYALTTQVVAYYDLQMATGIVSYDQIANWSNTSVSILWALYASLLTVVGFAKRFSPARYMGLILFLITAFKVVIDIWSLGEIYRIVSFIVFGIIALAASFIYVRYHERLIKG